MYHWARGFFVFCVLIETVNLFFLFLLSRQYTWLTSHWGWMILLIMQPPMQMLWGLVTIPLLWMSAQWSVHFHSVVVSPALFWKNQSVSILWSTFDLQCIVWKIIHDIPSSTSVEETCLEWFSLFSLCTWYVIWKKIIWVFAKLMLWILQL